MADLKAKVTFVNGETMLTTKRIYDLLGNREESTITFKKNKTLWLEGAEYRVINVEFIVFEPDSNGITCQVLVHTIPI